MSYHDWLIDSTSRESLKKYLEDTTKSNAERATSMFAQYPILSGTQFDISPYPQFSGHLMGMIEALREELIALKAQATQSSDQGAAGSHACSEHVPVDPQAVVVAEKVTETVGDQTHVADHDVPRFMVTARPLDVIGWEPIENLAAAIPQMQAAAGVTRPMFAVACLVAGARPPAPPPYPIETDPYYVWMNSDGSFARWPHKFPPTHFHRQPSRLGFAKRDRRPR